MNRRPGTDSGPGLLPRSFCRRGLPHSSRRASRVLTHPTSLLTSFSLCHSTSSSPPPVPHLLSPRDRDFGLPSSTTVSLALLAFASPLCIGNNVPSRALCLFPCPRGVCGVLVSLRFRDGPWRYPVPSITQVFGSPGRSLPSWPISLTACGLLSSPAAGSTVGVGPRLFLYLHPPPLPPMPSVTGRAPRHLAHPLRPGPFTLVLPGRHPGPNGCHTWAFFAPRTVHLP